MGRRPAEPYRRCVGCGRTAAKPELLRLVVADGFAVPDPVGRMGGRGAYICPDPACLDRATRRGGLARALRRPVKIAPDALAGALRPTTGAPPANHLESVD
ncbi:MAG: YlxR family protein [Actinobacteria bacterium]|nr:YlxR family protein [Actinomycetota bacterium]